VDTDRPHPAPAPAATLVYIVDPERVNAGPVDAVTGTMFRTFTTRAPMAGATLPALDFARRIAATGALATFFAVAASHAGPASAQAVRTQPSAAAAGRVLDFDDARFLLTRTGFAPSRTEIEGCVGRTRAQAVDALLAGARTSPVVAPPGWTSDPETLLRGRRPRDLTSDERKALQQTLRQHALELREWWIAEMLATDSPLAERMTLFWHMHFTSNIQKVHDARLMYRQNALFRREALGNFGRLLHEVTRDPAMLRWLDGARSRRGAPNENYAREVMELFTLGVGQYTQHDVVDGARAFTGLGVDPVSGGFVYRPRQHDDGEKTFLGVSGNLDADGAIDAILAQHAVAPFIVAKLWREFVSPTPDQREVEAIADRFRSSHYDIKTALRGLFLSDAFWAPRNRGTLVKSPVELVVGTLRAVGLDPPKLRPVAAATARMGEVLFAPPDVRGWRGGDDWITSSTLVVRKEFLLKVSQLIPAGRMSPPAAAMRTSDADIVHVLLPLPPVGGAVAEATSERDPRAEIRAALLDPVYEVK
jgi:uncharacterized protein (DUF1800 family)